MTQPQQHSFGPAGDDNDAAEDFNAPGVQISTAASDDLLDEIDGLLEANAEEFVRSYVQKGGQ